MSVTEADEGSAQNSAGNMNNTTTATQDAGRPSKVAHTIILDTGAIIKNEPPVSTLLGQFDELVTVPAIVSEIRDAATRNRFDVTLRPFVKLRSPQPASIKFVMDFARRTGDLAVLSRPDIEIIALAYEIECERNQGDWRLRKVPGQKGLNGSPPSSLTETDRTEGVQPVSVQERSDLIPAKTSTPTATSDQVTSGKAVENTPIDTAAPLEAFASDYKPVSNDVDQAIKTLHITNQPTTTDDNPRPESDAVDPPLIHTIAEDSDSDSDGWITPSNLKQKQAQDAGSTALQTISQPKSMQVAVLTTDFAMQNVLLQINLNLLSSSLTRVKHLKTFVLRCHACFQVTKDMAKQFCPRCGQPTLSRVSCSTNINGEFKLHLKKNMQWNTRGDRYSVPKPVHGSTNGKHKGGGKGGWGHDLILTEDQKEYQRATCEEKRRKERSLMDEDYLPDLLTGHRAKHGGRIKVGAGRNVNSRKR